MIQDKKMRQDKDVKNSKSKDEVSRSRSQSMNEQSRYKQEKTKTRPKKAKLKSQIKITTNKNARPLLPPDLQQPTVIYNNTHHHSTHKTSQSLTQPQQVDSPKKGGRKKTKSKRGKNVKNEPVAAGRWLSVEEELLATCYVAVSEDNNVGRSQKHETFWYWVLNEFNSKKFQKRTKDMLTSKWHTLNANCQKFNAAYKRAKRLGKSVAFCQEDAWAILKFHPKWDAPEQVDLTGDVPGATQEDLFGHDARPRPTGKPPPAKKTKSDATTNTDESSASTQFGELMEQELRLKREATKRAFEAQAEKDRTLMRLEELRPSSGVKLLGGAVSRDADFISGLAMRRAANDVDLMGLLSHLHDPQS
nr:reverse transcriptase domain-containing protein [Tanacetum cinerariifolium]